MVLDQARTMLSELPEDIDIENCFNVQPARFPLFINAPLVYQGVYLLTDSDQLTCQLLLVSHIAIVPCREMHNRLDNGATTIRNTFGLAQKYHSSGLIRQDLIDDIPQARAVVERLGPSPEAILSGRLHSSLSSPLPDKTDNPRATDGE